MRRVSASSQKRVESWGRLLLSICLCILFLHVFACVASPITPLLSAGPPLSVGVTLSRCICAADAHFSSEEGASAAFPPGCVPVPRPERADGRLVKAPQYVGRQRRAPYRRCCRTIAHPQ